MFNLDDTTAIHALDSKKMYSSIEELGLQLEQAWQETQIKDWPFEMSQIQNILVSGMGGSALGTRITQDLYKTSLPVPLVLTSNYTLPAFANKNTLFVASSYSGTTEETVTCLEEALKRGLPTFVIAEGGDLIRIAKEKDLPFYQIVADHNASGQPRMAVGYTVGGLLSIFQKIGLIKIDPSEIEKVKAIVDQNNKKLGVEVPSETNWAKKLASSLVGRIPIWVAAEHLAGVSHATRNQTNENAKNYADRQDLPELNHHLMEGLGFPATNKDTMAAVMVKSNLYHPRIQKRVELSAEVFQKSGIPVHFVDLESTEPLVQAFEMLHKNSYVAYYLCLLNGIDPSPIPMVDFFKAKLNS